MSNKYILVSKNIGTKFVQYKGGAIRLSKFAPYSVDEVVVKNADKPNIKRTITTFRDSEGKITERCFDYSGKSLKNRLYSYVDNVIGEDEFVTSKITKDYSLDREVIGLYKDLMQFPSKNNFLFWTPNKTTTHHVSENIVTGEKILSQVSVIAKRGKDKHSFIEFPHLKKEKLVKSDKRELSFDVKRNTNEIIPSSIVSNGVKFPEQDSFLTYRALTIEDAKVPFTDKYLNERNMIDKGVKIQPNYLPVGENEGFSAKFNYEDGVVEYNSLYKFPSKTKLVGTSSHEAEHSWQYFLQALLNQGGTNWQIEIANKFGKIKPKDIKEAKSYDKAIKNYVPFYVDKKAYRNNFIEKKAREKASKEKILYDYEGQTIRSQFKHIPQELL